MCKSVEDDVINQPHFKQFIDPYNGCFENGTLDFFYA